jgi:hypothetical protein
MSTIDRINSKMGRESIKLASEGLARPWKMKQGNKARITLLDGMGWLRSKKGV